jgi:two-component system, chemotaxis family, protein-glutamate methylesterase/glutaminase
MGGANKKVVVIGASTGGPIALERVLSGLPEHIGVPIIVIQHMPGDFTTLFSGRLNNMCRMPVSEAHEDELIERNHIYVVPGDYHFFLESPGPSVRLIHRDRGLSPSVDMGMISAVDHYGPGVIGVILSGMGRDGLIGAKAIKQIGGVVVAESKESATIYGMPREVIEAGFADFSLPLKEIPSKILEILKI